MGSLFSPKQTTQTTTSQNNSVAMPSYVTDAQKTFLATAPQVVQPYISDPASTVAPINDTQQSAISGFQNVADNAMGMQLPGVSTAPAAAQGTAGQATAGQVAPGDIAQFMSPYIGNVVKSAYNSLTQDKLDSIAQNDARAAAAGSFGGSRGAVGDAQIGKNYDLNLARTVSDLLNSGWQNSGQLAGLNAGLQNTTNNNNAGLSTQASLFNAGATNGVNMFNAGATNAYNLAAPQVQQNLQLSALQQLLGGGTLEQQTAQKVYDTPLKSLLAYGSTIPSQYSYNSTGTGTGTQTQQSSINPLGAALAGALMFA
jgi:hypothetical protein